MITIVFSVLIVAMLIDNILPFVIAPFYKGYSHKKDLLSVLGAKQSPVKHIYNTWCIISGLAFCFAGYEFHVMFHNGLGIVVCVLLFLYGFGCEIVSGIFPVNENKDDVSLSVKIHGAGSVLGFMALLFVPLFLAIMLLPSAPVVGTMAIITFVGALMAFCFFVMGDKPKFAKTVFQYSGLWQRVTLLFCYIPLMGFAIKSIMV